MNFLRKAFALCTGFAHYTEILDARLGQALGYLAGWVALLAALVVAAYVPRALLLAETQARWVEQKVPPFQIQRGQVHYAGAQPVRVPQDNFVFLLDTTGSLTAPETNKAAGLLLSRDSVLFWMRPPQGAADQVVVQQLPVAQTLPEGTVDGQYVRRWLRLAVLKVAPLVLGMLFVAGLLGTLAHAWFFTFTASLLERSHATPLSQAQLLNIAIHAVTPAALVCAVYAAFGLDGIDYWLLYLVVYAVFLIGAANSCRRLLFGEPAQEDESA